MEATILKWLKKEGDKIELDEPVLEIATDKVDSDVPSPVEGVLGKMLFNEGDVVEVGKAIAIIETEAEGGAATAPEAPAAAVEPEEPEKPQPVQPEPQQPAQPQAKPEPEPATVAAASAINESIAVTQETLVKPSEGRFYSPLVLNIARKEGIAMNELESISGTGKDGRVTKKDILAYVKNRQEQPAGVAASMPGTNGNGQVKSAPAAAPQPQPASKPSPQPAPSAASQPSMGTTISSDTNTEIVEMDRMRQLIADHMVKSKHTSPHVTSFVEADVTDMVRWRNKVKGEFQKREGEKLTFTPLFIEVIARMLKEFPYVNASVDGNKIIVKKNINIGMATALPTGNLIVPVIKQADQKNLIGLAKSVNDLSSRARGNKLKPEEIDGGTFTLTNVGTFGNLAGTPIISQPQVAILATGAITKKPAVLETPDGDVIAIRHMMFISMSYDHRLVDGAMGGAFIRKFADELEAWDVNRPI